MKRRRKWILVAAGAVAAVSLVAVVAIILYHMRKEIKIEPIPVAYLNAEKIWSHESGVEEIDLQIENLVVKIDVSHVPTYGTTIQYPDEDGPRYMFPTELYFGATDIKFDDDKNIIYIKVAGANPVSGPHGERIFEYDARRRTSVRDYWIVVED